MRRTSGFTLIELLVVVAIISILAAIALPNLLEAQTRAKVSRCKADMRAITTALEVYRIDHNAYAPDYDSGIYGPVTPSGEWRTYAVLTTPTAYLSSAPIDVFRRGANLPKVFDFYEYWGGDAVVRAASPGSPARESWIRRGVQWGIYTVGPDRQDQRVVADLSQAVLNSYDPTNGTISRGDIGRNNLGALPPE